VAGCNTLPLSNKWTSHASIVAGQWSKHNFFYDKNLPYFAKGGEDLKIRRYSIIWTTLRLLAAIGVIALAWVLITGVIVIGGEYWL
jgi:hypothetical protein